MEKVTFDEWALVELMGHSRIAGRVTEQEIGGSKFVRVDVPATEGTQSLTKFYGPSAIYAITPMTEDTARGLAARIDAAPVSAWDAQRLLAKPSHPSIAAVDQDDDDEAADEEQIF